MAWIEVHQHLKEHRKTRKFKNLMGISRAQAMGHLVMLWLWGIDNTDDCGIIQDADYDDIAIACDYHGDSQVIVNSLIEAGFLEKEGADKLFIHDFEDYIGRLRKYKERHREAQKRYSMKSKNNPNDGQDDGHADGHSDHHKIANLTVPNLTVPSPIPKGIIVLLPDESDLMTTLEQVENYPVDRVKDLKMYKLLQERYPTIDILGSIKSWSISKLSDPLKPNSNSRSQINTWAGNDLKWGKNLKASGNGINGRLGVQPNTEKLVRRDDM